jgi:PQQ-like domain
MAAAMLQGACTGGGASSAGRLTVPSLVVLPNSSVVMVEHSRVAAYSPNGDQMWSFELPAGDTVDARPVAALNSTAYVRGAQAIYALDPNGKLLWQSPHADHGAKVRGMVALGDSTLAITSGDNSLVAFDNSGKPRWTYQLPDGDGLTSTPVIAPNSAIYVRGRARIYAIGPQGNLLWAKALGAATN